MYFTVLNKPYHLTLNEKMPKMARLIYNICPKLPVRLKNSPNCPVRLKIRPKWPVRLPPFDVNVCQLTVNLNKRTRNVKHFLSICQLLNLYQKSRLFVTLFWVRPLWLNWFFHLRVIFFAFHSSLWFRKFLLKISSEIGGFLFRQECKIFGWPWSTIVCKIHFVWLN